MTLSPLQKRAERRDRNKSGLDMNLVSLIDIFTILIFFLLSSASGVEILPSSKAVKLPESTSEKSPRETVIVMVNGTDIIVEGRRIASVADVLRNNDDMIATLKTELDLHSGRQVIRKENEGKSKAVTIMGDKDIPYRLLRKVMYTAARANYSDVSFAVVGKYAS
ncbi:MAG: biopolymer transporter ExbD [Burkholderiaceae bacterium]